MTLQSLKDLIEETSSYKLPSHSKEVTNWTPNDGTLLKATNDQIEDNIASNKEESAAMQENLRYAYEMRDKTQKAKLKAFIEGGTQLAKWAIDEHKAHKMWLDHEKVREEVEQARIKNKYLPDSKELNLFLDTKGFNWDVTNINSDQFPTLDTNVLDYEAALAEKADIKSALNQELLLYDQNQLEGISSEELYLLTSESSTGAEIHNKDEFFRTIDDFKAGGYQIAAGFEFPKGSITNAVGETLPREMSYLDALTSTNIEDNAWAPYLEKAMWSAYYAHINKDYALDTLSDREIKNRIFKPFLQEISKNRNTVINSLLQNRVNNAKKQRMTSLLSTLVSTDPVFGGMPGITGKGGFIEQNEINAVGEKDNDAAWWSFYDQIDSMVKNEVIVDGTQLQNIIDQEFPQRGTNKKTTLQKLKPEIYSRLTNLAEKLKGKQIRQSELSTAQNVNEAYESVAQLANEAMESNDRGNQANVSNQVQTAMYRVAKENNITISHPLFRDFKSLLRRLDYDEAFDAIEELRKMDGMSGKGFLDWRLIELLPNYDFGSEHRNEKKFWSDKAIKQGAIGLSPEEYNLYERQVEQKVLGLPRFIVMAGTGKSKILAARNSDEYKNSMKLFDALLAKVMASNERELRLKPQEDRDSFERKLAEEAWAGVDKIWEDKTTEIFKTNIQASTEVPKSPLVEGTKLTEFQIESNQLADTFAETGGDKDATLDFEFYWSNSEQGAIESFLKNGEIPEYYANVTPDGRKFPNIPIKEVIKRRVEATEALRDGKTDAKKLFFTEGTRGTGIDRGTYEDLCIYPSAAKTGQKLCSSEQVAAFMLDSHVETYKGKTSDIETIRTGDNYDTVPLIEGKPLTGHTLVEVLFLSDNKNTRFGKYGLTRKRIHEEIKSQGIDENTTLFDEATQDRIMFGLMLEIANKGKQYNTLSSDYRRIKWLKPETIEQFNVLVNSAVDPIIQKLLTSPNSQFHTLSAAAAKALVDMTVE